MKTTKVVVVTSDARTITAEAESYEDACEQVAKWAEDSFYCGEDEHFVGIFIKDEGCAVESLNMGDVEAVLIIKNEGGRYEKSR